MTTKELAGMALRDLPPRYRRLAYAAAAAAIIYQTAPVVAAELDLTTRCAR